MFTALVLGGYGNFGAIISRHLAADPKIRLIVAGRDRQKAEEFARPVGAEHCGLDGNDDDFADSLVQLRVNVVIHCAGPFQNADYTVAHAAIAAGAHYIDIADGRRFVCDISSLDRAARERGVVVVSGASSVPALSSAVVDAHLDRFGQLNSIDTGISASERIPGVATVAAVLSYAGRNIDVTRNGVTSAAFGWQGLRRERFSAPVNTRWLCDCDVPDLELFPQHYDGVKTVSFGAGLGLSLTHLGTWLLAGLVRVRLLRQPERHARKLRRAAQTLQRFGNGASAIYVRMSGRDRDDRPLTLRWELIARENDGAQIPCLAAVALCRKLADGSPLADGARTSIGLLTLDEYLAVLRDLKISAKTEVADAR